MYIKPWRIFTSVEECEVGKGWTGIGTKEFFILSSFIPIIKNDLKQM